MMKFLTIILTMLSFAQLQCASNINWSFPPTVLSSVSVNSSDPHLATDASGDVVAVWVENGFVKASTKVVNMNWGATAVLSATGASSPRVVSDSNGNATAVWLEGGIVKAASKPFGGNWSSVSSLSTAGATSPALAVDSAGDVVAVWARNGNVESSTKLFGANWQARVTITSTAAASPSIAIGNTGANTRVVVVWTATSGSVSGIFSSTKLISGSYSAQQLISDGTRNATNAAVAVNTNGDASAIWYQYDVSGVNYSNVVVETGSRSNATGTWSSPQVISAPGMRNPSLLSASIAYDSIGNLLAVWNTSFDDATYNVESAIKPLRGTWSDVTEIVQNNLYSNAVDLSVTAFGDVLTSYLFYNGGSLLIQSSESDIDAGAENVWSVPITYSSSTNNCCSKIVASLNGNVMNAASVWVNNNGTNNIILASTGSRNLILPPSGLAVTQQTNNFGVFTEYQNTLSWTASTDPNVAGYLIFRNGVLIQEVDASVLQIVDHNRVQNGSLTYGVSAVDAQGSQSKIISVNYP